MSQLIIPSMSNRLKFHGGWGNGKCYGFSRDQNGELSINQSEAAIVCEIFDMSLQGKSILGIQRELETRAIKSPTGKEKWSKRTIDTMLSNEKYSGDFIIFKTYSMGFPDTKRKVNEPAQRTKYQSIGNHPAIISTLMPEDTATPDITTAPTPDNG